MDKVNIVICGIAGKMGRLIANLAVGNHKFHIKAGVEVDPKLAEDINLKGIKIGKNLSEVVSPKDIVIDFTMPEATESFVKECLENQNPIVIGTTGLSEVSYALIEKASEKIPVFYAPNMSFGVNLFFEVVKVAASLMKDYEVEISEIHHHFKKDAPSGTAMKIAEIICESSGRQFNKVIKYGREGISEPRSQQEIGIHSIRLGDIVGEHSVYFGGQGEIMEFSHRCYNRESFALGALKAATFLKDKKPGLYGMKDLIKG